MIRLLEGDWVEVLRTLPGESVHCVVTSPPYWGLRDYGVPGQLGLERTPEEYVQKIVEGFREVRRVLRGDGTCWVNLGDSYAGSLKGVGSNGEAYGGLKQRTNSGSIGLPPARADEIGLKPKDLCGIPWRVAFALQADGWWLRQDIVWAKPNPMPESVTEWCTKAHEYIFLLTKRERYFYDSEAIKEPAQYGRRDWSSVEGNLAGIGIDGTRGHATVSGSYPETGRNKRSVWTIPSHPFPEAHFATFPPELPEICIKAGCPEGGTVLDPFNGAGTTGLVASRLGRHYIGIDLSLAYHDMAEERIREDAPLFNQVERESQMELLGAPE